LMKATQRVSALRGGQPDDLIASGAGCEGISLRRASMRRKIGPNRPGIRGISVKMRLSVIVCTKNRARNITPCLDSIAAAFSLAAPLDAEIVIVDNGSTDNTAAVIDGWAKANAVPVQALSQPRPGRSRALNLALRATKGNVLAFTDDDCRLHPEHVNDLLRHDAADTDLVLRGGRVELGDPTDLPFTVNTSPTLKRWSLALNSTRYDGIAGELNGCNLTMRRELIERLGPFDENFGPGSRMGSCDDAEYMFRAYVNGITLEYVPDMTVFHHHGRKTRDEGRALFRRYAIGWGGLKAKYFFRHHHFYRQTYLDLEQAVKEIITGTNTFLPSPAFPIGIHFFTRGVARFDIS
jgi:glycosyltransferase involved in cell wall biosynthesis